MKPRLKHQKDKWTGTQAWAWWTPCSCVVVCQPHEDMEEEKKRVLYEKVQSSHDSCMSITAPCKSICAKGSGSEEHMVSRIITIGGAMLSALLEMRCIALEGSVLRCKLHVSQSPWFQMHSLGGSILAYKSVLGQEIWGIESGEFHQVNH